MSEHHPEAAPVGTGQERCFAGLMVGLDTKRNGAVFASGEAARSLTLAKIAAIAERGS